MFFLTSIFLVFCELYGWTTSVPKSVRDREDSKDTSDDGIDQTSNDVIREEDFPTLSEWLDDRDILYKERLRRVEDVCSQYQVNNQTSNNSLQDLISQVTNSDTHHLVERVKLNQFFVSRPYQVLGCLINKVASSSIVKTFLQLDGHLDPNKAIKSPHAYAKRLYPKNWNELKMMDDHYLKFIIVRDPLERLVSCYKDKLVTNTHWSLAGFRKTVKKRAEKERMKHGRDENEHSKYVKRSPDMATVFWGTSDNNSSMNESKLLKTVKAPKSVTIKPKPEDIPSFSDFLYYILSTDLLGTGFSSHWVPYWRACTPCHYKYSVIAKLETGEDDLEYIWKRTGIDSETPIPWENQSKSRRQKESELADFYSSVPRSLLVRVFQRYRLDYEMFGYNINNALILGGHDPIADI